MGSLLLDIMIKGTLALSWRPGPWSPPCAGPSAATRHAVWTMGMAAALTLPILSRLLPGWDVAMLPAGPARPVGAASASRARRRRRRCGPGRPLGCRRRGRHGEHRPRPDPHLVARAHSAALDHGELPALSTALCGELGISRRVQVGLSRDRVMPMVWGSLARSCSFRLRPRRGRRAPPQCPAPRARARAAT